MCEGVSEEARHVRLLAFYFLYAGLRPFSIG